jgi:S-DNA-T family DNA segregation ATPase FtsK/SpoIIIE
VGAVQDPRKEVLTVRDLFPTRIALRLSEADQVNLVLGPGARNRGALCDQIPDTLPGVGYVAVDGVAEPVRVRFSYITDQHIAQLGFEPFQLQLVASQGDTWREARAGPFCR